MESFIHTHDVYEKLGGFDINLKRLNDWELELKYLQHYPGKLIKSNLNFFTVGHECQDRITNTVSVIKYFDYVFSKYKTANVLYEKISNLDKYIIDNNLKYDIKYQYNKLASIINPIHILVIEFNNLEYVKSLINDLIVQTHSFDLTIIENSENNICADLYFKELFNNWQLANCGLRIIGFQQTQHLNSLWNMFYSISTNDWLCFLNGDVSIPSNFISDMVKVISCEDDIGIINHATNNVNAKVENILNYSIYDKTDKKILHRQGWDFTINRSIYTIIPSEFTTFVGDNIEFYAAYALNKKIVFLYSSPIIHYCSVSQANDPEKYYQLMRKEHLQYVNSIQYLKYGNTNRYAADISLSNLKPINITKLKQNIYCDNKRIIVSLTSWKKRISNIPTVLATILNQTRQPDKIVLNLALDEFTRGEKDIPVEVMAFIHQYNIIEINWVKENTGVYKKIIPTLLKYKNDLILSIDDDFYYPLTMIEDFYNTYLLNPNRPISGNTITKYEMPCHCGCASLVQYKFYNFYLDNYKKYYKSCPSSDLFYTYIANKNGYIYNRTDKQYFNNMKNLNDNEPYSLTWQRKRNLNIVDITYKYLQETIQIIV